jgi:hypothetical protein
MKIIHLLLPQVDQAIVCSPTFKFQPAWNSVRDQIDISYHKPELILEMEDKVINAEIITMEGNTMNEKPKTKRLLIFDDVSYEKSMNEGNKGIFNGLVYNAIWYNMSIISIVHQTTNIGAGMRSNAEYLILFNVNRKELTFIWETFGITKTKAEFFKLYDMLLWDPIHSGKDMFPFLFIHVPTLAIYYNGKEKIVIDSKTDEITSQNQNTTHD